MTDVFNEDHLTQEVVYWAPDGADADGQPTYATPVELGARWEDAIQNFIDQATGETKQSQAVVYLDADVRVRGILLLSALNSSVDQADPRANTGYQEIKGFEKVSNLDGDEYTRVAYL